MLILDTITISNFIQVQKPIPVSQTVEDSDTAKTVNKERTNRAISSSKNRIVVEETICFVLQITMGYRKFKI